MRVLTGYKIGGKVRESRKKIKIAIIGAGRVGVTLAEELLNNKNSAYTPRCFVDVNREKANRDIHGIPVLLEN
jgi:FlaA1/EpsC-like NDP-sugar epimerase